MKKLACFISVCLCVLVIRAITFNNIPDLAAHVSTPPYTSYQFVPWSSCNLYGGYGIRSNGVIFGSSAAAIWPVGPYAFVSAFHINNFLAEPAFKFEKILYLGITNHIQDTYLIANDTVLYTTTNNIGQWHEIWRGPYTQENVTCFPGFCFTNIGTIILTNMEFMAVLPGSIGNVVGEAATIAAQAGWGYATNQIFPNNQQTVTYAGLQFDGPGGFQESWDALGYVLVQPMVFGGSVNVRFAYVDEQYPEIPAFSNFGSRTGDSGGGLFVRTRGAINGVWKFVGTLNNGEFFKNSLLEFALIDQAIGWTQRYWDIVGQPANGPIYANLKSNFIATGYMYTNCPTLNPIPPSTNTPPPPPPPPPPPQIPPSVFIQTPTNGSTLTSIPLSIMADASDSDSTIVEVRFYYNETNLISIDPSAPYTTQVSLANGSYTLQAIARDSQNLETTSSNVNITVAVPVPVPPSVFITTPTNLTTVTNVPVAFAATASDSDGTVTEVRLYANSNLLAIVTTPPYTNSWSPSTNGIYVVQAIARDNLGLETTSSNINVTVNFPPPPVPPSVYISSPTNLSTITNVPTTIVAVASDSDGSITEVRFYANSNLLSIATSSPYTNSWSPTNGNYILHSVARDNSDLETISSNINVTIAVPSPPPPPPPPTNIPPSVFIASPSDGSTSLSIPISITATASDSDGTVTEVRFYYNVTNLILIDTVAPYSAPWSPSNGVYTIQAVARDNEGAETTSTNKTITVAVPPPPSPTVAITGPLNGSTLVSIPVQISANASVATGTIAQVRFYAGSELLGVDYIAAYNQLWSPTNGLYALTAVAQANTLLETTSSVVNVTIAVPALVPPTVSIALPTNGFTLTNASYNVSVNAADADGGVNQVRLYANGVLVSVDTVAPYLFVWSPSPNGVYVLTAVARDNHGQETTSAPVTITVDIRNPIPPPESPVLLPAGSDFDAMIHKLRSLEEVVASLIDTVKMWDRTKLVFPPSNFMLFTNRIK
jgi:hypothetical protein